MDLLRAGDGRICPIILSWDAAAEAQSVERPSKVLVWCNSADVSSIPGFTKKSQPRHQCGKYRSKCAVWEVDEKRVSYNSLSSWRVSVC